MKKERLNDNGITIVALVITIIIIIILATVTINMTFGDNGLITQAKKAKDMTLNSIISEQEGMNSVMSEYLNVMAEDSEIPLPDIPDIPGGEEAVTKGAITFTNLAWASNKASVKISTNTSYTLQYQVVANEGASIATNWETMPSGGIIGNLNNRDVVYARLTYGTNYGDEASTTIKDETTPTISNVLTSNITHNSITVTVTANDNESGLATSGTYKYYLNGESSPRGTNETGSYTFTGLNAETEYTIEVVVIDKANNEATQTTTAKTAKKPVTNVKELKPGDWVKYLSAQGNIDCVVLYDSSSSYGVEIITMETVEYVTIGDDNNIMQWIESYNNAIDTLNSKSNSYNNSNYSTRARCVGSVPNNVSSQSGMLTSSYSYMANYSGKIRGEDDNYITDWNQIQAINIGKIGTAYCLASRKVFSNQFGTSFHIRVVTQTGGLGYISSMCMIDPPNGQLDFNSSKFRFTSSI